MAGELVEAPLKGNIFCCTAIDADLRAEIAQAISAMGGIHKTDLMSDAQYLIVGNRSTPKFEFAVRERLDMKFLRPSCLLDIFAKWREGADVDIETELYEGRLRVFEGFTLCCSNISADPDRAILVDIIRTHGGTYLPHLTRDVTHLITPTTTGKKYQYAKKWGALTVAPEWVTRSVERGAALLEDYFFTDLPKEQLGKGACVESVAVTSAAEPPKIDDSYAPASGSQIAKLRSGRSNAIWDSILGGMEKPASKGSIIEQAAWDSVEANHLDSRPEEVPHTAPEHVKTTNSGIFSGQVFKFIGFDADKLRRLHKVVISHQGKVFHNTSLIRPTVILIYSHADPSLLPFASNPPIFTEWAIERSLHKKELCLDEWGSFVSHRSLHDMKGLRVAISGFSGVERLHLERLITLLGAKNEEFLVQDSDILVSTPKSQKLAYANEWKIPVVDDKWLWRCAFEGRKVPITQRRSEAIPDKGVLHQTPPQVPVTDGLSRSPTVRDEDVRRQFTAAAQGQLGEQAPSVSMKPGPWKLRGPLSEADAAPQQRKKDRKLTGRAIISTISEVRPRDVESPAPEEAQSSQVTYLDLETQRQKHKLLAALGADPDQEVHVKDEFGSKRRRVDLDLNA